MSLADKIKKISPWLLSTGIFVIANIASGGFNFIYQYAVSLILPVRLYGMFYPLSSFVQMFFVIGLALQYALIFIFNKKENLKPQMFLGSLTIISLVIGFILYQYETPLMYLFHIDYRFIGIFFFCIFFMFISMPYLAFAIAKQDYLIISIAIVLGSIFKVVYAFIIALNVENPIYPVLGHGIYFFTVFIIPFILYFSFEKKDWYIKHSLSMKEFLNQIFEKFLFIGLFNLIFYLDPILVRIFNPELSGFYSVLNLLGRIAFFALQSVIFVLFSMLTTKGNNKRKTHYYGLLFIIGCLALYQGALTLFSPLIHNFFFQGKFDHLDKILPIYNLAYSSFVIISYLGNRFVLDKDYLYPILIVSFAILECVLLMFFNTISQIIIILATLGYGVVLILFIRDFFFFKKMAHEPTKIE